jgi:hypothetical protein
VAGQLHDLAVSTPGKRPNIDCRGGWVGLGFGLNVSGNLTFTGIRITDRPARSKPTRLPRPADTYNKLFNRVPQEQP